MGTDSKISYVEHSLGFWRGCNPVSAGCDNCYALREMELYGHKPNIVVRGSEALWKQPGVIERKTKELKWRSGDRVFVCPWSDFWHPEADKWRAEALEVMRDRLDLRWIIPTKRIERALNDPLFNTMTFRQKDFPHLLVLVTTENQDMAKLRIPDVVNFKLRYPWIKIGLSIEPMLGGLDLRRFLSCGAIDQVIIGAESGNGARYLPHDIVSAVVIQCLETDTLVFVKQLHLGSPHEKYWVSSSPAEWPDCLQYQQFVKF